MDVAGFPSRENVCSNILAFYLNPAEEHGLGDLLLTSLFRMFLVEEDDIPSTDQVRIQREYGTDERKRMFNGIEVFPWQEALEMYRVTRSRRAKSGRPSE